MRRYVIVDEASGAPARWSGGENRRLSVPLAVGGAAEAGAVVVRDTWDGGVQDVEVRLRRSAAALVRARARARADRARLF